MSGRLILEPVEGPASKYNTERFKRCRDHVRDRAEARRDPNWPDNLPRLLKVDMETTREPWLDIRKQPGDVGVRVFNMTPDDGMVWYTAGEMELNGGQPANIKRVRGFDRVKFPYGLPCISPGVHSTPGEVIIIEVAGFRMQHTLSDCETQQLFVNLVGVPAGGGGGGVAGTGAATTGSAPQQHGQQHSNAPHPLSSLVTLDHTLPSAAYPAQPGAPAGYPPQLLVRYRYVPSTRSSTVPDLGAVIS
jgi:hypothetical protein